MNKRKKSIKEKSNLLAFSISIVVPMLLLGVVYAQIGIYWGGERTVMASDSFHQLSNFYASYHDVLHGKESFLYSWSGALGNNYWALCAYYVNSVFTFLVGLVDKSQIPDMMYVITLLKFGAAGGSFWVFSQQTTKLSKWLSSGLSVSYALMSFSVVNSLMLMWLDALVYLPLILLGIHRVMEQRKPTVLFLSYLLLFLSNFYMAFMVGVFSFVYVLGRMMTNPTQYKKTLPMYLITSFLAGGASMVTIFPTVLDLKNNGEALSELTQWLTPDTGAWDMVVKSMIGVYDTTKFGSAPFIYVGIFPLLFAVLYFFTKEIPLKQRLLSGGMVLFLILSVYVYPLNLFWHGLHAPNMFLFRFSFLLSFFILVLAQRALENFSKEKVNLLVNTGLGLFGVFLAAYFFANKRQYDYLSNTSVLFSLIFLAVYIGVVLLGELKVPKKKKWLTLVLFLVLSIEAGLNTQTMVQGVFTDWTYPLRTVYSDSFEEVQDLVDQTQQEESSFYRMANLDGKNNNESFTFGYSGISQFSSIRNRRALSYLNKTGFRSDGTNLTVNYENNTLLMDSLFGLRYNLSRNDPMKFGFEKVAQKGAYGLYKNAYALPLGILTDEGIYDKEHTENQTALFNYLSGDRHEYVQFTQPVLQKSDNVEIEEEGDFVYYSAEQPGKDMTIEWAISTPEDVQTYLSLYAENSAMMAEATAEVTVNGVKRSYQMKKVNQYYNLGFTKAAGTTTVKVTFKGTSVIRLLTPDVMLLSTRAFQQSAEAMQEKGVEMTVEKTQASAKVTLNQPQVLLTTIPYDKGWQATIDGKSTPIRAVEGGLLSVSVPEGTHDIRLVFRPEGFRVGVVLFFSCLAGFIGYLLYVNKKKGENT